MPKRQVVLQQIELIVQNVMLKLEMHLGSEPSVLVVLGLHQHFNFPKERSMQRGGGDDDGDMSDIYFQKKLIIFICQIYILHRIQQRKH